MKPIVVNGEIEIFAFISKIVEKTYCPLSINAIKELILKKFKHFDIEAELYQTPSTQIEKYQGKKPWEKDELNEEGRKVKTEDPKEEKRVKTILKAFRKGVIKVQHPRTDEIIKFRYYINDPVFFRWEYYMSEKQYTVITNNFPGEGITIYCDDKDVVDKCTNDIESISKNPTGIHLREMFMNKLKRKFDNLDVSFYINERGIKFVLGEPTELNEGAEVIDSEGLTDKDIKKVKTLYKLLKKGHFKYDDHSTYGYILPEDYHIYKDELGDVCIKLTGEEEIKMVSKVRFSRPSDNFDLPILPQHTGLHGWIKTKVMEKFDGFNIKFIF
jgi:hypothetical protein